jgi:hypothetical protein
VVLTLFYSVWSIQKSSNVIDLEKEVEVKSNKIFDLENGLSDSVNQMNELFNSYILLVFKNLEFDHNERISVYKVHENKFILLGRASTNPRLKVNGRTNYPIDEGFIARGWEQGQFFIENLPDPNIRSGEPYFKEISQHCNISKEVVSLIKMKSRSYFVHRLNGYDSNPKALIVIESTLPDSIDGSVISEKLTGIEQPLVMFVEKNNGIKFINSNNLGL